MHIIFLLISRGSAHLLSAAPVGPGRPGANRVELVRSLVSGAVVFELPVADGHGGDAGLAVGAGPAAEADGRGDEDDAGGLEPAHLAVAAPDPGAVAVGPEHVDGVSLLKSDNVNLLLRFLGG